MGICVAVQNKIIGFVLLAYGLGWFKKVEETDLVYFNAIDFGPWFPVMSPRLVNNVDKMAMMLAPLGYSFKVSRAGLKSEDSLSQHNVTEWGEVRALDLNVRLNGLKLDKDDLLSLYSRVSLMRLFTGIGVYPNWNTPGIHVDVREDRTVNAPATWGDIGTGSAHNYVTVMGALV
jgi:hypothetical protein